VAVTGPTFRLTEGPVWLAQEGCLLFTDLPRGVIHRLDPDGTVSDHRRPSGHANGLTLDAADRLIACESAERRVTRMESDGAVTVLASHHAGRPLNAPNDVVASRDGRVWFTDPSTTFRGPLEGPRGPEAVYLVTDDPGAPTLLSTDFDLPNGLCLSPDEQVLYVNDTIRREIRAFDLLPDGTVTNERTFVDGIGEGRPDPADPSSFGDGHPDGMTCDEHGNVWCTGPFGIWILSPAANLLGVVRLPEPHHHARNLGWGGPGWSTLWICAGSTEGRTALVFRVETATRGTGCHIPPRA
jgi:gluconolactonase